MMRRVVLCLFLSVELAQAAFPRYPLSARPGRLAKPTSWLSGMQNSFIRHTPCMFDAASSFARFALRCRQAKALSGVVSSPVALCEESAYQAACANDVDLADMIQASGRVFIGQESYITRAAHLIRIVRLRDSRQLGRPQSLRGARKKLFYVLAAGELIFSNVSRYAIARSLRKLLPPLVPEFAEIARLGCECGLRNLESPEPLSCFEWATYGTEGALRLIDLAWQLHKGDPHPGWEFLYQLSE